MMWPRGWRGFGGGRLLQDDVCVGAADAEGTDAGAARAGVPFTQTVVDVKRAMRKIDLRIGLLEMQARRQRFMRERQHGFDEASDAGCRIEVADVGLH